MKFHTLPIARIERETRDAVAVTFAVPPELAQAFRWQPGQHLTVRARLDGRDLRRSYSICTAPADGDLTIAIKRAPGGVFSHHANTALKVGDTLDVMVPMGHFGLAADDPAATHRYVAFAAGSGITPILSIVRATLQQEPGSRFTLVYGNRSSSTVMFAILRSPR